MSSRPEIGTRLYGTKYLDRETIDKPLRVKNLIAQNGTSTPTKSPGVEDGKTWVQDTPDSNKSGIFGLIVDVSLQSRSYY